MCLYMEWISINEQLPEVGADGESDYVLVCNVATRALPRIVRYSNGEYSKKGWWTQNFDYIPIHSKIKSAKTSLTFTHFTHWAKIDLPEKSV